MGAGRTELVKTIFGAYPGRWTGEIFIDGVQVRIHSPHGAIRYGMGLVSEDCKRYGLILDADVVQNMTLAGLNQENACIAPQGIINQDEALHQSNHYIESLRIRATSREMPVSHLSGGNQQKAILGKWLMTQPQILFLDEPTRGIDVGAKAEIHKLIAQLACQGVAVVMVSSELPEILGMSDRVIVLHEGQLTGTFINNGLTQEEILRCAAGRRGLDD